MDTPKLLYENSDSIIYYSDDAEYPVPVIIKVLKADSPEPLKLQQFYNEYEITKSLRIEGVRKAFDSKKINGKPAIVFEYIEGQSIKELITRGKIKLREFLPIAISITEILDNIHEHNVIHKDLNSKNILISKQREKLFIVDFGISSKISLKSHQLVNPDQLEGSLAYLSPEQTGRMNRFVDYRTDFYSLGVTFYEMLTGRLPFQGDDPVELVHAHIAKNPELLNIVEPEVPKVLAAIISKMLCKNAEDRYQSASGIKKDLQKCLDRLDSNGAVANFALGEHDYSGRFQIPQKLYGRDADIAGVMKAFDNAANGSNEMVIISGFSGVGKTALVHEIYKPVTEKRGYFIEGKFDQFQRNTPYFSFLQAFTAFFSQLLTESSERLKLWRERLQEAVGDNGKLLTEVIPRLELIIGKQQEVEKVGTNEAQHRFNYTFINFLNCIATRSHPLVIFIDDLQWADSGSLNLIRQIMTEGSVQYLLLITAYRDNEVDSSHPWFTTINEIKESNPNITRIFLKGLDELHIDQMVGEMLNDSSENAGELSKLIYQKTEGNPFFVNEFLKSLHSNNMIMWNASKNQWQWHVQEIRAMNVTDNVIHFLSDKMQKLSKKTYQLLQYASCIGNRFSIRLLGAIFQYEPSEVRGILYEAIEEGYVIPFFIDKKTTLISAENDVLNITYKFTHDRVQQAVYSEITDEERCNIHYKIGNYLLKQPDIAMEIFTITDHLNNARSLIRNENEIDRLAHLNYDAGLKAKDNNAHEAALSYYESCLLLITDKYWDTDFDFIFNAMLETAEERYINHSETRAEELIDELLNHARSPVEKSIVLEKKVILYTVLGRLPEALATARKALGNLGVSVPTGKIFKLSGIGFQLLKANRKMIKKKNEDILNLPEVSTIKDKMIVRIIYNMLTFLYYLDQEIFIFLALYMANHSMKKGNSIVSPIAFVSLGIVNAAFFQRYKKAYELAELAFRLNEKYYNGVVKGRLILNFTGGIRHWTKPVREQIDLLYSGYKYCMEGGDLPYAGDTVNVTFSMQFYCGKNLPALLEEFEDFRPFIDKINDHKQQQDFLAHYVNVKDLMASKENQSEITSFDEIFIKANSNRFTLGYLYVYRAFYFLLMDQPEKALEYTSAGWKNMEGVKASIVEVIEVLYHALATAACYNNASSSRQRSMYRTLKKCLKQYKKWSAGCEANYGHAAALIEAEILRIDKNPQAPLYYGKAIDLAHENKLVHMEALSNEMMGKYFSSLNLYDAAFLYLKDAMNLYERWGATVKVNFMKEKYAQLTSPFTLSKNISKEDSFHHSGTSSSDLLDMMSVLKSSTAISGEITIEKLLGVLMNIMMENAGAQKGYFMLLNENKYLYKSTGNIDEDEINDMSALKEEMLPDSIIQYVSRTKESVVLEDSAKDTRFASDPYIRMNRPKSVLTVPIISKGEIIALVYLENNLVSGAFGPKRLELLKLLSGQIAVSIENASLYNKQFELNQAYQRFVPLDFIHALGHQSILQVKLGDNIDQEMTVMFCDIRAYTTISDGLSSIENFELINSYLTMVGPVIRNNNGFINHYLGDGFIALFKDKPEDALRASIEMLAEMDRFNTKRIEDGIQPISLGIGLHTGQVMMGIIGDYERHDANVISDAVNVSARMEGLTKIFGSSIVLSDKTLQGIEHKDQFQFRYLGRIKVKGKTEFLNVYEMFNADEDGMKEKKQHTLDMFNTGLKDYFNKKFPEAAVSLKRVLDVNPNDKTAKRYLQNAARYLVDGVPENWDGVEHMTEK